MRTRINVLTKCKTVLELFIDEDVDTIKISIPRIFNFERMSDFLFKIADVMT